MTKQLKAIKNSSHPITISKLIEDLKQLGLCSGDTVLIHSSLSALGWVVGGAQAVVEALCQVVLPQGTLVMPTHSSQFTEPRHWQNPPVPQSWWETIRAHVPAYDPHLTPTCGMGAIVECFRHVPGVLRSSHPTHSFAAVGPLAQTILEVHSLEDGLGECSPLGTLARLDAKILLLGVGFDSCTMLHLAEAKAEYKDKGRILQGSAIIRDGQRQWISFYEQNYNSDDFLECGEAFLQAGHARTTTVGQGRSHLFNTHSLLKFAVPWLEKNRNNVSLDSTPFTSQWNPIEPSRLDELLKGFSNWCLAGGQSIDCLLGRTTRTHEDTDIALLRSDLLDCLKCFNQNQVFLCTGKGSLSAWQGQSIPTEIHSLWILDGPSFILQILVFDCEDGQIFYRRDRRIHWPVDQLYTIHHGMRLLNPMITILFKLHGRELLPKDCHDITELIGHFDLCYNRDL